MRLLSLFSLSVATLGLAEANILPPRDASSSEFRTPANLPAAKRALPNSPSNGYAPATVPCPSNRPTIRTADALSSSETSWLERRRNNTVAPMIAWFSRMNITGFDATSYIDGIRNNASALPNIAIAMSGGGYRALMNGAGFLAAADDRTRNATNTGQIGGLLQAATYVAGLSGGGWLVGSIYNNNFSTVENLRDGSPGSDVWKFGNSVFEGPTGDGIQLLSTADYWDRLRRAADSKEDAGFEVSITDYWGRALSYQLINATDGGPAYTFSSIALADDFISGSVPMPFLVADGRAPGTYIVSLNSTVFEFNPFEVGTWDPQLYGFAPLQYIGTNFTSGTVPADEECVAGFDQSGFVMGTSSTLFNQAFLTLNQTDVPSYIRTLFTDIVAALADNDEDIAQYRPNPFYQWNENTAAQATTLDLVDGGEDLQNIPLHPLIQPVRHVDVIFAVDSSADTEFNWPNGTALVATYQRTLNSQVANGTSFPYIPDQNTFVNLGLNSRPTFFGCDHTNTTSDTPLIVYIPNSPYVALSNVSTYNLSYTDTQRNSIIQNGYEVATLGNGTLDVQWPACMACAALSRSFDRTGFAVPSICTTCFQRYCWDGTVNSTTPVNYSPAFKIADIRSGGSSVRVGSAAFAAAVGAAMLLLML